MAAGDLVQKGTAVSVGFQGNTNTNLIMQAFSRNPLGNMKEIAGEQGATVTEIYTNPGHKLQLQGVVKNAATEYATLVALIKGSPLTINSIAYRVDDVSLSGSAEETRATIDVTKLDSMTHS
jgi:hypothetical protein